MKKFFITYRVSGSMTETVEAESLESARIIADSRIDDDTYEFDLDTIDDVDACIQELYRVKRDGRDIWVSYIRESDERIQP